MPFQSGNLVFLFVVTFATISNELQFFMDPSEDRFFCGHLQCWADKFFTDPDIVSVVSLDVYEVSQPNTPVKMASLLEFDQNLYVDQSKVHVVNATGKISNLSAEFTIGLRDINDCLNGSFMCELGFIDKNNLLQGIQERVSQETIKTCPVYYQTSNIAMQIRAQYDFIKKQLDGSRNNNTNVDKELSELRQENVNLKTELSKLQEIINSSYVKPQFNCSKGVFQNNTMEKFLLWGKVPALCDTVTDGGGWVVIQRRTTGDMSFYKAWDDYKIGFGNTSTDFWLGLDNIHNLTSQGYNELRFDIKYSGTQYYAIYTNFAVADEASKYRITVNRYSGTAEDSLLNDNGMYFSTYDRDNDEWASSCAVEFQGGWWYNTCGYTNLNGVWGAQGQTGNWWWYLMQKYSPLDFSEIKIRHY